MESAVEEAQQMEGLEIMGCETLTDENIRQMTK